MSICVVEFLELIDINDQQHHLLSVPAVPFVFTLGQIEKGAAVHCACQKIGRCHFTQFQFCFPQFKVEAGVGHHKKTERLTSFKYSKQEKKFKMVSRKSRLLR